MKLWVKTLSEPQILIGLCLNYCQPIPVLRLYSEIDVLRDNGHSLLIGNIFSGIQILDANGKVVEKTVDFTRVIAYLKYILKSRINFQIVGDRAELDLLRRYSPPIYDKLVEDHIIWKGQKRAKDTAEIHQDNNGEKVRRW